MCPIFILIILHEIWNAQHEKISWTNSNQHGGRNITKEYVEIDTRVHQLFKLNSRLTIKRPLFDKPFVVYTKIQQTKMLVTCQRFGDWFLFGLVWPYSSNQKNIIKVGSKSMLLTCSSTKLWAYLYYIFLIRRES